MIIRQASLDAFKRMAITAFEDEMVEHCKTFAPTICGPLSKKELHAAVHQGLEDAGKLGFTRRGAVQFHLECMLTFGSGFATDPQYPWIGEVLARDDFEAELHKSEALYEAVKTYLDDVAGTDSRYVRGCLRRILRLFEGDLPVQQDSFAYDMAHIFEELHPEKTLSAGPVGIETLVQRALNHGRDEYGLTGTRSVALFAILLWLLGHDCDRDPFHPWIRQCLTVDSFKNSATIGAALEKRAMVFFEAYLQELV